MVNDPAMADFVIEMRKMSSRITERTGKESVTDPALVSALTDIKGLLLNQSQSKGERGGVGLSANVLVGVIGAVATIIGIVSIVIAFAHK